MIVDTEAAEGEVIWRPDPASIGGTQLERFVRFVRNRGVEVADGYRALWEWSVDEPDAFWALFTEFANVRLGGEPGPVRDGRPMPETRWFPGRSINYARHMLDGRDGLAIIAIAEDGTRQEVSFADLRGQVGALAAHLRALGIVPGDRVAAVLPNVVEAVVGLLAAASIGAVWSVCSPEFGAGAITSRFAQLEPKVLLAAPGYRLGGSDRDRRSELTDIVAALPSVQEVVWVTEHASSIPAPETRARSRMWRDVVAAPADPEFLDVEFSHPLWVLFSSGTTGVPKGIVHGHGGALLETLQMLLFSGDLQHGDRFFSVASTSWVVWNALVGVLGVGGTAVLLDGNPTFPSIDRVWEVAAETRARVLGVGAGFLHASAKTDLEPKRDHDLSALKCVQVTGSPLSADGFRWVYRAVGDVWLASMSGGTDVAGCFVAGTPTEPVRVGYIQVPCLGVKVEAWDAAGHPVDGTGELVITVAMPSMPLYFWGDDDGLRYRESYFHVYPGVWRHGDYIEIGERGIVIRGRSDSTLNRNGIRLGSADIYAVVEALPEIAEALVVGAEIGAEGYYLPLFLHVNPGVDAEDAKSSVIAAIRTHLSVRYLPDEIVVMRAVPHTKTGKKLEVPVKRLLQGAALADVVDLGAVDDPELMAEYAEFASTRSATLAAG